MKTSPLFEWNLYPELYAPVDASKKVVVVNQGGTSSGKTYTILQVLFRLAIHSPGLTITVVGQDIPNLKRGAIRDAKNIVGNDEYIIQQIEGYNGTDKVYNFKNGSIIEFTSYADEQDAKNGKRDILFINEANGIPYSIYNQLNIRTTYRTYLDYNPTSEFWVHEKVLPLDNVAFFISNYEHNPFISPNIVDEILRLKEIDPQLWRVYGEGQTGKIEGLVFNYRVVDQLPEYLDKVGFGMDFGFTNDPTTLIRCGLSDGEIYLDEYIYQTNLTNNDINLLMQDEGVSKKDSIFADSADPKSIRELYLMGWNITGAEKGADSIMHSINLLKSYGTINITKRSKNMLKEAQAYKWKIDKTGEKTNKPIDAFNHAWDAVRYWALGMLGKGNGRKILAYG